MTGVFHLLHPDLVLPEDCCAKDVEDGCQGWLLDRYHTQSILFTRTKKHHIYSIALRPFFVLMAVINKFNDLFQFYNDRVALEGGRRR